jgi:hypothetical protein
MKVFVWIFLFVGLAARADNYLIQCGTFARFYKAEVSLPFHPVYDASTYKSDPKDAKAIVGYLRNAGPITLRVNEFLYKTNDRPLLAYVNRSAVGDSHEILYPDWIKRGPAVFNYETIEVILYDQAGTAMPMSVSISDGEMTAKSLTAVMNGTKETCSMAKDKSAESEALINAPTPMQ